MKDGTRMTRMQVTRIRTDKEKTSENPRLEIRFISVPKKMKC